MDQQQGRDRGLLRAGRRPASRVPPGLPAAAAEDDGADGGPSYEEWLGGLQHFRTGPWGWLLIAATVLVIGPLAALGVSAFPPGHYPRAVLLIPGFALAAVLFFALSPAFFLLDRRRWRRRRRRGG